MQPRLTHIALHVKDLDVSVAFYEELCGLRCVHRRGEQDGAGVAWLAEPGREQELILVFIGGGEGRPPRRGDYSHLGFAVEGREQVDAIARRADAKGCLVWPPREEPYPVGYYCGLVDPDGTFVEFSYGQPLGPGAEELDPSRVVEP